MEKVWDEEWADNLLGLALDKVRHQVSPKQYQLFYLHVSKGLPAKTVAQRLGVKLPEVYFAKYKISKLIQKEILTLEERLL